MRLGLGLGYSGARVQVDVQAVQDAERLGYTSVWTAESYGSDAVVPLAWVGALTYRIQLGTAILQMAARTPAMTAMTAMTLDALSGGRALLGLGVSGPQVVEGWHGQPFGKPLGRTREYVAIVRAILARQRAARARRGALSDPVPGPGRDRAREAAPEHPARTGRPAHLPRRDRPEERRAGRRARRRLAARVLLARAAPASSAMRWPRASPVRVPPASGSGSTWRPWRPSSSARTSTRAGPG